MAQKRLTRETVSGEALFILRNLKENVRHGRSNRLSDVKTVLEPAVSLDFDTYFFFLRKFHYISLDREAQLRLTDDGEQVVGGEAIAKFANEVTEFFADRIVGMDEVTHGGSAPPVPDEEFDIAPPPPPVESEEIPVVSPPKSKRAAGNVNLDDTPPPSPAPPAPTFSARSEPEPRREAPAISPFTPPPPPPQGSALSSTMRGTDVDARYVKFDPVGQGPLGTVYKGRHNSLGLDVAVKELKDIFGFFSFLQRGEVVKRLRRELCAQAQVRHPSVVAVLDQNTDVAKPYVVLELLRGSLREVLDAQQGKPIAPEHAVRYFLQLAYGLRAAHQAGLFHHNLKPENVLFDQYGNVKVADFGLSRVIEVEASKGMPQVIVGTGGMAYMAPELISRGKDLGAAADVYALGILLYEMVTGQLPGRRSPLPSEVNNQVPAKLDAIFDKMTQDRLDHRYPTFDAVLDDFYAAFTAHEYGARGDLLLWSDAPQP